jgi:hypothetical protein
MSHADLQLFRQICDSGCTFILGMILITLLITFLGGGPDDLTPL